MRQPFPDWARSVLGSPRTNAPTSLKSHRSFDDLSDAEPYGLVGPFAYLLPITPTELAAMSPFLGPMINLTDHRKAALSPTQIQLRKLLKRFGSSLSRDSIVADLSCNDGEFARCFSHCRYLAMDIWPPSLTAGLRKGQIKFGVLADVRSPPLVPQSLDAFVSTSTMCHLPDDQIPDAAVNLLRFIKPGGRVAMTVPAGLGDRVAAKIPSGYELLEREITGGELEHFWGRTVSRRTDQLIRRLPSDFFQKATAAVQNRLSAVVAVAARLRPGTPRQGCDSDWLVVRKLL